MYVFFSPHKLPVQKLVLMHHKITLLLQALYMLPLSYNDSSLRQTYYVRLNRETLAELFVF